MSRDLGAYRLPSRFQPRTFRSCSPPSMRWATHLLTGDKDHFGRYYGLSIEGVLILRPASYMVIQAG